MKNVLVIVDAQNDFIDGALGSQEAQSRIPNICDKIRNYTGGLIIITQDTHTEDYLETKEGIALPVAHCIKGSSGWRLNKDVECAVDDNVASRGNVNVHRIQKPTFGSMDLMEVIGKYVGSEEFNITFIGYCTDICVLSNALLTKTMFYETANIFVDAACCAGVTKEKHKAALEAMKSCQIIIENEA